VDSIEQRRPATDRHGTVFADVSTTDQTAFPGESNLSVQEVEIENTNPATIMWLPAEWDDRFYITCYNTPRESDFPHGPERPADTWHWCSWVTPPSKNFKVQFMTQVMMNGNGEYTLGNETKLVRWEDSYGCYRHTICSITSAGDCAQAGRTIAVDRERSLVVPFNSTVEIPTVGNRHAEDAGGDRIVGYDIDVYNGIGEEVCNAWQNSRQTVRLLTY
jgi:3D (Asp-Asp-Asp) domain-containing protein